MNYIPVLLLTIGGCVVVSLSRWPGYAVLAALVWIYVVPPLICRLTLAIFGRPAGHALGQESRGYKVWWFLLQLQSLHNRLPWLEELLRNHSLLAEVILGS